MRTEIERPDLRADTKDGKAIRQDLAKIVEDLNVILGGFHKRIEAVEKSVEKEGL